MRVLVLILDGSQLLDIGGPAQVVETARLLGAPYELHFVGTSRRRSTALGLGLANIEPLPKPAADDWIIVSGLALFDAVSRTVRVPDAAASKLEQQWLRQAFGQGSRLSSVCAGAFVLGDAGVLDHRRSTTHWLAMDQFRARFPLTKPVENVLFIDDGQVITCAGAAAGIDMALHLVGRDFGSRMVLDITRGLVLSQRRGAADAQLSSHLCHRMHLHAGVHLAQDWLSRHVEESATLEQIARIARMSVRSLTREFRSATGLTVLEFREKLRLEQAQSLAEAKNLTLEEVAYRCGFGGSRQLRRVWRKHHGDQPLRATRV